MVTVAKWFQHGHTSLIQYTMDWTQWLADGESLVSAEWTASDEGVVIGDGAENGPAPTVFETNGRNYASVWVGAAENQATYTLTCRVTTSNGQIEEESIGIAAIDR